MDRLLHYEHHIVLPSLVCPDRESEGDLGVEAVDNCVATDMFVTLPVDCVAVSLLPASVLGSDEVLALVRVTTYITVFVLICFCSSVDSDMSIGLCDACDDARSATFV